MRPAVIISPQSPRFFHLIIGFLQMLKHLISISALVVVASGACFDNGDKEIGGACYKFVAQKLSFNDARDWCHYKNPVTASYLAHVPNQFTANFLASYARSAFGQNDGYFWIGLSRTKNWTPWTWDTGYAAAFTNFNSDQLTQNWAAESVVNTKWSTFGEEEKMNFVCSYDPTEPPTFAPPTSAGPTTTPRPTSRPITTQSVPTTTDFYDSCLPGQNTLLFYGYSNDLAQSTVASVGDKILSFVGFYEALFKFVRFANVKFDLRVAEQIFYHDDRTLFDTSIHSHLPDPSLGFADTTTGSDLSTILRTFLSQNPPCGSFVLLSVKRNIHDQDLSEVIRMLQKHRISVFTFASDQMIGGADNNNQLYQLSSRSNGLLTYDQEANFAQMSGDLLWAFASNYPYYSTNLQVQGHGSSDLPMLYSIPATGYISVAVTVQNHPLNSNFQSMVIKFDGPRTSPRYNITLPSYHGTCYMNHEMFDFSQDYKVSLDYQYADNTPELVEIRVYTTDPVKNWPPYTD